MMPASKSLIMSPLTTSFILGFKCLWGCLHGLDSSNTLMRCIQMEGSIPLRSSSDHPIALGYFLKVATMIFSCSYVSNDEMMTGNVLSVPRKIYFKLSRRGFSSSAGACSKEVGRGVVRRGGRA